MTRANGMASVARIARVGAIVLLVPLGLADVSYARRVHAGPAASASTHVPPHGSATPSGAALGSVPAPAPAPTNDMVGGCVEHVPEGAVRPTLVESFPERGTSGYAAVLAVDVEHGKGESVLPRGLDIQSAGDSAGALKGAKFVVPDQDGGGAARLTEVPGKTGERQTTRLELSVVPLPDEPGRHTLMLPPVPVAVARASGEIVTVCTRPHAITVEDPTSSVPDAKPRPNPPARRQREEWTSLRNALAVLLAGVVLGGILAYVIRRWRARPKPLPPPPPPRPPWETALEQLDEVRHAGLLEQARFGEYYDRVSDAVRRYLGARFGFDGLESTTDEIIAAMDRGGRAGAGAAALPEVVKFLRGCDLVKFANATPTLEECTRAIASGESIVRNTMPIPEPAQAPGLGGLGALR